MYVQYVCVFEYCTQSYDLHIEACWRASSPRPKAALWRRRSLSTASRRWWTLKDTETSWTCRAEDSQTYSNAYRKVHCQAITCNTVIYIKWHTAKWTTMEKPSYFFSSSTSFVVVYANLTLESSWSASYTYIEVSWLYRKMNCSIEM